jgi:hypothetical protein
MVDDNMPGTSCQRRWQAGHGLRATAVAIFKGAAMSPFEFLQIVDDEHSLYDWAECQTTQEDEIEESAECN